MDFKALSYVFFTAGLLDYTEPIVHQQTAWIKQETGCINPNSAPHQDGQAASVSAESFHVPMNSIAGIPVAVPKVRAVSS